VSDWNLYLERKLALRLGLEASRLADAIARYTLGWNGRENEIGQRLLRDLARLHGLSFDRAREELIDSGLIHLTRGDGGRGHRDCYELLLDQETPASERAIQAETPAQTPAETPAPERARREKGVREDQDQELLTGAADVADATPRPQDHADREAAWGDLVDVLDDADDRTLTTFQRHFARLIPAEIHYVRAEILKRDLVLESPSAYAFRLLENRLNGTNGNPDLPSRWTPA